MTLIAEELSAVCDEVAGLATGLAVQKVVQPDDETVLVQLRSRWLLLCCSARGGRLHLIDERPAGTGEAAPAFCMLLRKHLVGARLAAVHAVEGERACELELVGSDETALLRLFLFGRAAQLQLVLRDGGEERVLGAIGPARRTYDALPAPHPHAATTKVRRFFPGEGDALSRQIASAYSDAEHGAEVDEARRLAEKRLSLQEKKLDRLVERLTGDLARVASAEGRRKEADLLLAHLHEIPRGAASVTLPDDFTDGSPIEISLDPARSPKANVARLYKEHQRLHRARGAIERRLAESIEARGRLAEARAQLAGAADAALLAEARAHPTPTAGEKKRDEAARRARPYKRYTSVTGAPIYVGRGAAKNDELTFKIARGNDLWLHTRDVPGAHVVVPLASGRAVDPETLVDAATLAVHHSTVRDEAQVDVGYALRKHLRKAKGAPPGSVLVSQQKTIRVRMEPQRLKRLLGTQD